MSALTNVEVHARDGPCSIVLQFGYGKMNSLTIDFVSGITEWIVENWKKFARARVSWLNF